MIVGLTGGIGSGKSTVSAMFANLGITIVDTDVISRQVVEPETPALIAIHQHFGDKVIDADGQLNRSALRAIIFNNQDERLWLENLLHPIIHQQTKHALQASTSPYTILSSPLLLETADKNRVNRVLVVDAPLEQQLARSVARDQFSEEHIKNIIATQFPRGKRLSLAHDVIDNSGDLVHTQQQVLDLHEKYLKIDLVIFL